MSAIKTTESRLLSLPAEILSSILQQLTSPDLKCLRLCSSSARYLTEPVLFKEITVVPHQESFRRLISLSEHSRIKHHVKTLHYDHRWGNIALHLLEVAEIHTNKTPFFESIARLSRGIVTEKAAQIEIAYLSRAISSLPSLTTFSIGTDSDLPIGKAPRFYQRLRKLAGSEYDGILKLLRRPNFEVQGLGATSVFSSFYAVAKSLQKFHTDDFDCSILATESLVEFMAFALQDVRSLSLCFRQSALSVGYSSLSRLAGVLRTLLHLEDLELKFDGYLAIPRTDQLFSDGTYEFDSQSTCSQLFPSPMHFPNLKRLTLGTLFATDDELVALLERHAATLSYLALTGAVLARPKGQDTVPCWVRTFKRFQTCLNLEKICLSGHFMNGSNQDWLLRNSAHSNSLKARLEAFIVLGGKCPVEDAVVEDLSSASFAGDESWEVIPPVESTNDADFAEFDPWAGFELTSDEERQLVQDAMDEQWLGTNDGSYDDWDYY